MKLIKASAKTKKVIVIECNIDDYTAEHLSYLGPAILDKGALDFTIIPATMKKERQGMILQLLCPPDKASALSNFLLKETTHSESDIEKKAEFF